VIDLQNSLTRLVVVEVSRTLVTVEPHELSVGKLAFVVSVEFVED